MKIWSSEHIFDHSWETVIKAAIQKYPNPLNPNVIGIDVIDREINLNGIIRTHRLFTTHWGLAPWISKIIGGNRICHASEHSLIDLNNKTMILRTRNLTLNNIINVDETLIYKQHLTNPQKTHLTQESVITVKNVPLTNYMENLVASTINGNAQKGRLAIEWVIKQMNETKLSL